MQSTAATPSDPKAFKSFSEFYPFYLTEHSNQTCRRLHFVGSSLALLCLAMLIATGKPQYLLYGLLCVYGFAWVGQLVLRRTSPPVLSVRCIAPWVIGLCTGISGWVK